MPTVHNASNTYAAFEADIAAAQSAENAAIATAKATLNTALANAQAAYTPNDGGKFAAAVNVAYANYSASVASAQSANEPAIVASYNQHKRALNLP